MNARDCTGSCVGSHLGLCETAEGIAGSIERSLERLLESAQAIAQTRRVLDAQVGQDRTTRVR